MRFKIIILLFLFISVNFAYSQEVIKSKYLKEEIKIVVDRYGVSHIYAKNNSDLFFAFGFCQAMDRLIMMDALRRAATGRISEMIGMFGISFDKEFLRYDLESVAEKQEKNLSPETKELLNSFVQGINFYIQTNKDEMQFYKDLGVKPKFFTTRDVLATSVFFSFQLASPILNTKLLIAKLLSNFEKEKVEDLFNFKFESGAKILQAKNLFRNFNLSLIDFLSFKYAGSNNWVLSGKKTKSKNPILCNDPHLPLTQPAPLYEVHLCGGDFNITGVTIPGTPVILIGFNENVSFGATVTYLDVFDIYIEELNEDGSKYKTKDGWSEFIVKSMKINYKSGDKIQSQKFPIYRTKNGIVLKKDKKFALVIRWPGYDNEEDLLTPAFQLMKSKDVFEFDNILQKVCTPSLNFVFADVAGNIGYRASGYVPIRKKKEASLPFLGSDEGGEWIGFIPTKEMPHIINPKENFIVTANNKIMENKKYYLSNYYSNGLRAKRIKEILSKNKLFDVEDMKNLHNDKFSYFAKIICPYIISSVSKKNLDEKEKTAFNFLKKWDYFTEKDSIATSIFHCTINYILKNTYSDELKDLYNDFLGLKYSAAEALINGFEGKTKFNWFDNINTKEIEKRDDIIFLSFKDAIKDLTLKLGENVNEWKWGKLHTITFRNDLDILTGKKYSVGPYEIGSGMFVVDRADYELKNPYSAKEGAPYRLIVEMEKPPSGYSHLAPGQNEDIISRHYNDQVELWLNKNYRKMFIKEVPNEEIEKIIILSF